ncbi:RNA polymerase sigma-70 factor (ECF subfamily) [Tenacibaculum lutimaris]|uniref:RNA polymerase sigma-70 factor (ECF subfamily) n=1 Tax=Tenacibaculum lutimaris TaxID=285258 RepID=A0A420E3X3_9FLAO|nr:sigma-70 family RNA polymerase sigma factor [Tenacibaculum lutimaris]RKF04740.1 RNA polymerase sigma-70 factor (ECF subfamily) [Tenacibaculum lutimaris]
MNVIEEIIEGNQKAFKKFYDKTHAKLFSFTFKHTSDFELSKEIIQDSFVILWERKKTLTPSWESFEAYLFKVIRNKCIAEYKQKIVVAEALLYYKETQELLQTESDSNSNIPSINKLLNTLPSRQRRVIELVKLQGLSYKEAALELNISERTVEAHLRKAFDTLRIKANLLYFFGYFLLTLS